MNARPSTGRTPTGEVAPFHRPRALTAAVALAVDTILVVAFAAVGRASHDSDIWSGLWQTAWPFLTGLGLGWLLTRAWQAPTAPVRTGLGVGAVTVATGMLLRAASGQGTAVAFIVVAAVTLLGALAGWRFVVAAVRRARSRRG